MPPEQPPEKDLRDSLGQNAGARPPYNPPPRRDDYVQQAPPPYQRQAEYQPQRPEEGNNPAYSEVVTESDLTGIRIVAKFIDLIAIGVTLEILLIPFNVIPGAFGWFGVDEDEFAARMENAATVGEILEIMMSELAAYLIFVFIANAIWTFVYFFISEYITKQTLGKKVFGLRVIDQTSGRMTASQAALRAALTTLSIIFYFWVIDILIMLVRKDGKSIIDTIAGTTVIRVKKIFHYPTR